jgi:hypothetical protein
MFQEHKRENKKCHPLPASYPHLPLHRLIAILTVFNYLWCTSLPLSVCLSVSQSKELEAGRSSQPWHGVKHTSKCSPNPKTLNPKSYISNVIIQPRTFSTYQLIIPEAATALKKLEPITRRDSFQKLWIQVAAWSNHGAHKRRTGKGK